MFFRRPRDEVIAEAEVQRQTLTHAPVIFAKYAKLIITRAIETVLRANAVVVSKAGQHFRHNVAGGVAGAHVEVALAGDGAEVSYIATDTGRAELEAILCARDRDGIIDFIGIFRDLVSTVVACVVNLIAVAANQRASAQVGISVGIHNA